MKFSFQHSQKCGSEIIVSDPDLYLHTYSQSKRIILRGIFQTGARFLKLIFSRKDESQ